MTLNWVWMFVLVLARKVCSDVGSISGYPQVDMDDLSALTLTWNQVHYLVRENLLEIDDLRRTQEELFKELYECFGLENCLKEGNMLGGGPPQTGGQLGAGALLASLREERKSLLNRRKQLEERVQNIGGQLASSSSSTSYSYSSSSSGARNQDVLDDY